MNPFKFKVQDIGTKGKGCSAIATTSQNLQIFILITNNLSVIQLDIAKRKSIAIFLLFFLIFLKFHRILRIYT